MKKLEDYRTRNEHNDLLIISGELPDGLFEYKTNIIKDIYSNNHTQAQSLIDCFVMEKFPTATKWNFYIENYGK